MWNNVSFQTVGFNLCVFHPKGKNLRTILLKNKKQKKQHPKLKESSLCVSEGQVEGTHLKQVKRKPPSSKTLVFRPLVERSSSGDCASGDGDRAAELLYSCWLISHLK